MSDVVLADSDRRDRDRTAAALRLGGYRVQIARGVVHAASLLRRPQVAAVIVDPAAEDAAAVVLELRARTDVPIIITSNRSDERDKVAVLDAGADDYLAKPFGVEELLARLRALLRRAASDDPAADEPIVTPHFTIRVADRYVMTNDGAEVHLTRVEWRIVEQLVHRCGHLVTQEELLLSVWGPNALDKPGNIRVNMVHIRAKLEPEPSRPRYFLTAPGLGLRFDATGGQ